MTIKLEAYQAELDTTAPGLSDLVQAVYADAVRQLSPAGLEDLFDGACGLARLGKGSAVVVAYLDAMPMVARECGEEAIRDCRLAVMKLASMTSGDVLAMTFASLPAAASRFSDAELVAVYLQLLHRLAARVPRGLRPMLSRIDELLNRLTLSGLRAWAEFGAEAHQRNLAAQAAYFGLESQDSRAVLERERRGTLFVDVQRRLSAYLRAFWGRDFLLRPTISDHEDFRCFIEDGRLHLPDAADVHGTVSGLDVYRAMAAHLAAHLVYTGRLPVADGLTPAERFLIGFVEDARVERLAVKRFPGLRRLWRSLMPTEATPPPSHPTIAVLERFALALLDPAERIGDAKLDALAARFHAALEQGENISLNLGRALADHLTAQKIMPSLRLLERIRLPWRDDNRFLWQPEHFDRLEMFGGAASGEAQIRRRVGLMEFINETDVENAGDDAQEIWVLGTELFPYEDEGVSYNQREGRPQVSAPVHYPEWDYQMQVARPNWVTLREHAATRGAPAVIDTMLTEQKAVGQRVRRIVDQLRPQGLQRVRRLEDGEELDLGAAVDAMVMLRLGRQPDARITMRNVIHRRDLAALILIDLSESTNEPVHGSTRSVIDLTREACALLSTAISGIGDPFAIHGFSSNGRHDVRYMRFKDFDQRFDADAKSKLAGMSGGLSTRMGAAMRHAGRYLAQRREAHRLLLVITDGAPADVDERDPQHLRMDTKKAVEDLRTDGIRTYCLSLDPLADRYVERIFGAGGFAVIDHVSRLPERLPTLFGSLTR
ncbi:nitric oxide reductase activation protein NorD [Rhodopseudomonas pseudopalustris]|uniref:von Willebrand factor type A domain-containing protein n=1 Tax=Rhodopseudomonas pseudopalustris TaxID=1513892 RepID=A0A1H8ULD5_9BRAD|nr:VWA domain-containing protein [Rhodopseudomonas pseudopalustris]SEP03418.1 von Willebrand factor type A domain-containing protein [Rhodopseudomonas pseudopalustris]